MWVVIIDKPILVNKNSNKWWTRSQRIRTVTYLPLEIPIVETRRLPTYQRIADRALHLERLGLSRARIAAQLHVSDKTVAKAIAWLKRDG